MHNGKKVTIMRNQDQKNIVNTAFAKTSRKCPPFCIQPMQVAPGVGTVGEAEIFRFMDHEMNTGDGLLVDARTPSWHSKGTIPGSVNIPFTVNTCLRSSGRRREADRPRSAGPGRGVR